MPDKTPSDVALARLDKAARCLQAAYNAIAKKEYKILDIGL